MRTLSFTRRKPSVVLDCEAAQEVDVVQAAVEMLLPANGAKSNDTRATALAVGTTTVDHPLQPSQFLSSAAEPSSPSFQQVEPVAMHPKARSSPMSRLRRMMRSQSDGSDLDLTLATANRLGVSSKAHALAPTVSQPNGDTPTSTETDSAHTERHASQCDAETTVNACIAAAADESSPVDVAAISTLHIESLPVDSGSSSASTGLLPDKCAAADTSTADADCDVFLNASIQLLHSQSDARQRIRQLWFTIQRLHWEQQVSDAGVDLLHAELLAIMKSFSIEKLDGARYLKAGYLTLVQAPNMVRMWCTLSEEYGKLEMIPARDESSSSPPHLSGVSALPLAGLSTTLKLPSSLSWLFTDALQSSPACDAEHAPRAIKLHGCQVRRVPAVSPFCTSRSNDTSAAADVARRHQLQVLVPTPGSMQSTPNATTTSHTGRASQVAYSVYTFDVADSDGGEDASESWACALDRVCMFHLYVLEQSIRDTQNVRQYRDVLARHLPLCVSLTWLRNRIDRYDPQQSSFSRSNSSDSPQQQQHDQHIYQHEQQQRRSSKNLSMIQIIKDLERDQVLVDETLIAVAADSSNNSSDSDTVRSEYGTVSGVVKHLVMRVMAFVRCVEERTKRERTTARVAASCKRVVSSSIESSPSTSSLPPGLPTSPTNRFTKYTEARALVFVERVLRGSSRTQSGGDIYDAIRFFCQHRRVSICPVSHAACPVEMTIVSDDASDLFQIDVHVRMQFKVVEMTPLSTAATAPMAALPPPMAAPQLSANSVRSDTNMKSFGVLEGPKEWAVLEGTLSRQFTLGRLSEPGTVTIASLTR